MRVLPKTVSRWILPIAREPGPLELAATETLHIRELVVVLRTCCWKQAVDLQRPLARPRWVRGKRSCREVLQCRSFLWLVERHSM